MEGFRNEKVEGPWQAETVYFSAGTYFNDVNQAIRDAQSSVDIETYIFDLDKVGNVILSNLLSASRRGVKVRIVVDGFGSLFQIPHILEKIKDSSVKLGTYNPLRFTISTKWAEKMNRRLHRKIFIVDNSSLFFGSFNITDNSDRETGARVTGGQIGVVVEAVESIWNKALKSTYSQTSTVLLNYVQVLREAKSRLLAKHVSTAKQRVWITNPYFVPGPRLLAAIASARRRDVEVLVIVPQRSDPRFMRLVTETYYRGLLVLGVRIFEYKKSRLHAKTIIADDWLVVGSSNINSRSLLHDLEIDVVLSHRESLSVVANQFQVDREHSVEIKLDRLKPRPFLDRIFTSFILLFIYWL